MSSVMGRVTFRFDASDTMPGPAVERAAADRLRRTVEALDLIIVEPVETSWTAVDEDGVGSTRERWVVATAIAVAP